MMTEFRPLRWLSVLLLSLLWATMGSTAAVAERDDFGRSTSAAKGPPNPYGSKGKPDHQAKVDDLTAKAKAEAGDGDIVVREKKLQGHDSNRKPDVQTVGPDGKTKKVYEAERHPNRKRNLKREAEYDKLGLDHETHGLK
jgi:hypothetical protein